jgi:hypothetical protein
MAATRGTDGSNPVDLEGSYYEDLGVSFEASIDDIRRSYYARQKLAHPDRRQRGGSVGSDETVYKLQAAWKCLGKPSRRLLYDLRNFGKSSVGTHDGPRAEERLIELMREEAAKEISAMHTSLDTILRREQATRGVVVKCALYGDLRVHYDRLHDVMCGGRTVQAEDLVGPFLDVTLPVQNLVDRHHIIVPGGPYASKSDLQGFYHPAPLDHTIELSLYVLYDFRGSLHEVICGDRETLSLPLKNHALASHGTPRGPLTAASIVEYHKYEKYREAGDDSSVVAAGERPQGESAANVSRKRRTPNVARAALDDAVTAYRFQGLAARSPGDATPGEFLTLALVTGGLLALAWYWRRSKC